MVGTNMPIYGQGGRYMGQRDDRTVDGDVQRSRADRRRTRRRLGGLWRALRTPRRRQLARWPRSTPTRPPTSTTWCPSPSRACCERFSKATGPTSPSAPTSSRSCAAPAWTSSTRGIRTKPRDDMSPYESSLGLRGLVRRARHRELRTWPRSRRLQVACPNGGKRSCGTPRSRRRAPRRSPPCWACPPTASRRCPTVHARRCARPTFSSTSSTADDVNCLEANAQLGAFVRGGLNKRESGTR